jgi:hypothetical protein
MALDQPHKGNKRKHDDALIYRVYGCMEWFSVAEQPPAFLDLPSEFSLAYKLWQLDGEKNFSKISKLIKPFLSSSFVAPAISNWEKLFIKSDKTDGCEYEALRIHLAGVDFSETPFPCCRAEAWFDVPMIKNIKTLDLEEWQNKSYVFLTDAISFRWEVPRNKMTEALDFSYGSHLGVEATLLI